MGIIGILLFLAGVVGLIRPSWLRLPNRWVAIVVIVIGLIVMGIGAGDDDDTSPALTATAETEEVQAGEEPETKEVQAGEEPETKEDPEPEKDYYDANQGVQVGIWGIAAHDKVEFRDMLGTEFFNEKADEGYTFALIAVSIKNTTNKTDSLGITTIWHASDDRGYEYDIQTMADIHLGDARLSVTDVPPEARRSGYLVFQVMEDPQELYLEVKTTRGSAKWRVQ